MVAKALSGIDVAGLMDATDRNLLNLLRRDGRATFASLAQALGVSEGTIRGRMKRLQASGEIQRFTVRTRGGGVRALIEVNTGGAPTAATANAIAAWPAVELVWETTGDWDLSVVADLGNPDDLNTLIDQVRALEGVQGTRSRLILNEH